MICFITSWGTAGDVLPLAHVAVALKKRGHTVRFFGDPTYRPIALEAGLRPADWENDSDLPIGAMLKSRSGQRWLRGERLDRQDRELLHEMEARVDARWRDFLRRIDVARGDRVVAAVASISAWRRLHDFGRRTARIVSCPMPYQPTREFSLAPPIKSIRERLFVESTHHLVSASPVLLTRPRDWKPHIRITGYPERPGRAPRWSPPAALKKFLSRGEPPVYVGFGSYPFLSGNEGRKLTRAVIAGCKSAGVRCVLQSSSPGEVPASADFFPLAGPVPHEWLFARCKAAVHHGGYGTVHASLRAGLPTITYPFQTDQFLWTRRLRELGAGPGFTASTHDITAKRLAADLRFALRPETVECARRLSRELKRENGLAEQVSAIEAIIRRSRLR